MEHQKINSVAIIGLGISILVFAGGLAGKYATLQTRIGYLEWRVSQLQATDTELKLELRRKGK